MSFCSTLKCNWAIIIFGFNINLRTDTIMNLRKIELQRRQGIFTFPYGSYIASGIDFVHRRSKYALGVKSLDCRVDRGLEKRETLLS